MVDSVDRRAVIQEVRLIIVEALREGDLIRPEYIATFVARSYPNSGFAQGQIAQHIRKSAIIAGARIEGLGAAQIARDHSATG